MSTQELFCHLQNYRFKIPTVDNFQSFCDPIKIFLDCWKEGEEYEVIQGKHHLMFVNSAGLVAVQLMYVPHQEAPLTIMVLGNEYTGAYDIDHFFESALSFNL